jgi:hypothetical protein
MLGIALGRVHEANIAFEANASGGLLGTPELTGECRMLGVAIWGENLEANVCE